MSIREAGELDFNSPHFVYLDMVRRLGENHPDTLAYETANRDVPDFPEIAAQHRLIFRILTLIKIDELENVAGAGI